MQRVLEQLKVSLAATPGCPPELIGRCGELIAGLEFAAQAAPNVHQLESTPLEERRLSALRRFTDAALHLERLERRKNRPLESDLGIRAHALGRSRRELERSTLKLAKLIRAHTSPDARLPPLRYLLCRAHFACWAGRGGGESAARSTLSLLLDQYTNSSRKPRAEVPETNFEPELPKIHAPKVEENVETTSPEDLLHYQLLKDDYAAFRLALKAYGRNSAHPTVMRMQYFLELFGLSTQPWKTPGLRQEDLWNWCQRFRLNKPQEDLDFLTRELKGLEGRIATHYSEHRSQADRHRARKSAYLERSQRRVKLCLELIECDLALVHEIVQDPEHQLPHWLSQLEGKDRAVERTLAHYESGGALGDTLENLIDLYGVIPDAPRLKVRPRETQIAKAAMST